MKNNRIVIGDGKKKDKDKEKLIKEEEIIRDSLPEQAEEVPVTETLDENVWGTDSEILKRLDDQQLAERRLFVRVRLLQQVDCTSILEDAESAPVFLDKPIPLTLTDLSMGGIGAISDKEFKQGNLLVFKIVLDNIAYEVKSEIIYCFPNNNTFRIGLKLADKDKAFIKHLKIFVARISLQSKYGN